jgi:hypothetical protein
MIGFATIFANAAMCFFRKDFVIGFPEIAEAMATSIRWWYAFPEFFDKFLHCGHRDHKGNHLACSVTKHDPNPAFILAKAYE